MHGKNQDSDSCSRTNIDVLTPQLFLDEGGLYIRASTPLMNNFSSLLTACMPACSAERDDITGGNFPSAVSTIHCTSRGVYFF